jgi:hypothetical protein
MGGRITHSVHQRDTKKSSLVFSLKIKQSPITEQDKTVERYEAVKDWIRQNYA